MLETAILLCSWIVGLLLFFFGIPSSKRRLGFIGVLVMQSFTWPLGLIVAELNLIVYPIRFFQESSAASFTFEYFAFPVTSALFNIHYPKNPSFLKVFLYTSFIVSILTGVEVLLEAYTDNIEYVQWEWYWSWLSMFALLHVAHRLWKKLI